MCLNPALSPVPPLPEPAAYFPVRPRYDVAPALRPLSTDFGHGRADTLAFQIDRRFPTFRESKLQTRAERLDKYHSWRDYPETAEAAVNRLIIERLAEEHPEWFRAERGSETRLHCSLTGEILCFAADGRWLGSKGGPEYVSGLDALAMQVQEDLAVTLTTGERDWLAAVHVCSPSGWVPEEKVGLPFTEVHRPVPGMERIAGSAPSLVRATVERGPFVRFVWGIAGDDRWNHHPEPPPGVPAAEWRPPAFRRQAEPPFYFRVERQVLWGLPQAGACLFVIGPYHTDPREIRADPCRSALLCQALRSMGPEALAYKGIKEHVRDILNWLEQPPSTLHSPPSTRQ